MSFRLVAISIRSLQYSFRFFPVFSAIFCGVEFSAAFFVALSLLAVAHYGHRSIRCARGRTGQFRRYPEGIAAERRG